MSKVYSSLSVSVLVASTLISSAFAGPTGTTITGSKSACVTVTEKRTFNWTLQKAPENPNQVPYIIPEGQSATANFVVTATRNGPVISQTNGPITGEVCLQNTGSKATQGLQLVDQLEQEVSPGVWNPVAGPITIPTGGELAAGASQCFPYSINFQLLPNVSYRNHAIATIDNFLGFEGTAHSTDIIAPVNASVVQQDVDPSAVISDLFACPAGFSCTPSWNIQTATDSAALPFSVILKNNTAACGQTFSAVNTATLIPSTTLTPVTATSAATIFTGSCH